MRALNLAVAAAASLLVGGAALAADLPTRKGAPMAPYTAPVAAFTWTGPYVGAFVGGNWSRVAPNDVTFAGFGGPTLNSNGLTAGGLAGWNWGFNGFILGGEVEAGYDHKGASASYIGPTGLPTAVTDSGAAEGRARARLGWGWDRWMAFVAGGGTAMDLKMTYAIPGLTQEMSHWRGGWNVGGGVEWAFADHWSVRGEYIYDRFGDRLYDFNAQNAALSSQRVPMQESTARAALIYKF